MAGPLTAFIEEAYQEALALITELRDYLAGIQTGAGRENDGDDDSGASDPQVRILIVGEISTMTRNMTEAMAWLLLQKAAAAGEITAREAQIRADGLLSDEDSSADRPATAAGLPLEVRGYIDRSRRLYDKIHKLRDSLAKSLR